MLAHSERSRETLYKRPITKPDQAYILSLLINPGYWGELNPDCLNSISRITQMDSGQIKSLYRWTLIDKARRVQSRIRRSVEALHRAYCRGKSILDLSRQYDLPPVSIFRALLSRAGYGKKTIKNIINQPELLTPYDEAQLRIAFSNDIIASSTDDHLSQLEGAQAFENEIKTLLQAWNVRFATEHTLSEHQIECSGRAVSTPDFLLLDGLTIRGKKIYWIECKSYFGASIPIIQEKVFKQSQRYVSRWGPGVVIFKHGYTEDFVCPQGVDIQDISFLK